MDHSTDVSVNVETAENDSVVELRAEIQKLKNRLRGANQAREQVRLQNVFVASLQAELAAARAQISALEAERQISQVDEEANGSCPALPHDGSTAVAAPPPSSAPQSDLEETNKELLEMCTALESELEREQKEYDNLSQLYTTALSEHKTQREAWEKEIEALKKSDLHQEVELKSFQLAREKEVVAQLQDTVSVLRREMERAKQKQHLREKTINENYEEAMEQLQEDRQRLQQEVQRLQQMLGQGVNGTVVTSGRGGANSNTGAGSVFPTPRAGSELPFVPVCDAEREAYATLIHQLQMEIVELRKKGFIGVCPIPSSITSSLDMRAAPAYPEKLSARKQQAANLEKELEWVERELLGRGVDSRTIPEGCVKVLNFTDPTSRVVSSRAMFSVPTNFIDGNWF